MTMVSKKKNTVWQTDLPLKAVGRGKVRDIYAVGEDKLLIVTSDRLSAFDVVLPKPIPFKGKVLTQISVFWFDYFKDRIQHHLITADVNQMGFDAGFLKKYAGQLEGRSMLVKRTKPLPVECVVRGYITGSGWKDYQKTGRVCGHTLPGGLRQCDKLEQPLFTPATKAVTGHDENIDFEQSVKRAGAAAMDKARELSLMLYGAGRDYAAGKGILIADTKFEFGIPLTPPLSPEGRGQEEGLILIDEVLTPDSSRFWPKDRYEPGRDQPSYDKQIVRNYLLEIQWDQTPPGPELPDDIIEKTSRAYLDVYKRLTGKELE